MVCIKTGKACILAFCIGFLGSLFSLTPWGENLEEAGLDWFYKIRGPLAPPKDVTIISIDKLSVDILRLPDDPEKWPRSYYAELINKLNQQAPAIIAFNINFAESRDNRSDKILAEAMVSEKNVILSNYLERRTIFVNRKSRSSIPNMISEKVIYPIPLLENSALDVCPFPLPKTSSSVKQFWVYKASAGGAPTFPSCIFLNAVLKKVFPELLTLLIQTDANLATQFAESISIADFIQKIYPQFTADPTFLSRFQSRLKQSSISPKKKQLLQSWLNFHDSGESLYFNHYGRAGTITTIPFYQALVSDILHPETFHNKIILVGYSENIQPEKSPGFYNVYSSSAADTISPIEIAATAVANLIDNSWIKPLPLSRQFLMVLLWGMMLAAFCRFLPFKKLVITITFVCLINFLLCYYLFKAFNLWLPVVTPVFIQAPLIILAASIFHFVSRNLTHQNLQKAFSFYLPKDVVEKISSRPASDIMNSYGELKQGVCLATDAGQYTTLSEFKDPMQLADLMNQYYSVMFPLVQKHGGIISDVIGDAMMALWAFSKAVGNPQQAASLAAIEIINAIDDFNQHQPDQLPTRIGLHYGSMRLGNVGAKEHYEYRAVGDIINTATRIEGLNKLLGTRILASEQITDSLSGFFTREVGQFILKGKTKPISIHELVGPEQDIPESWFTLKSEFFNALNFFKNSQWAEALQAFSDIKKKFPNDGPTLFYIHFLEIHQPFYMEKTKLPQLPAVIETEKLNGRIAF
jgi:adenylate cyclase